MSTQDPDVLHAHLGRCASRPTQGTHVAIASDRVVLSAASDLVGLATGRFSTPSAGAVWERGAWPADIELLGFAFTQFALPVTAGGDLDFDFRPAPGLRSPSVVSPLLARSGERVVLLAPIDHFHEQVIAVTSTELMWGWHGDLDEVPAGFSTTLGVYEADSVTNALASWRDDLAPTQHRRRSNALSTHLSYWTDNGAAYWYRTEPGRTISESVTDKLDELASIDVPVRSIELDSWFYPHVRPREIAEIGYPHEVPPSGMAQWSPRADAFAPREAHASGDQLESFAQSIGSPPLVLHARHVAPDSPYVDETWWVDEHAATPSDPAFFRRWFDDALRWGATVIEQDWMLVYWFGVRELRAAPGRAELWQRSLNEHARATDVDLLWCMATPADLMLAASLDRVIAIRTSDDYRFAPDPAMLWTWFLTVNRLANTFGIPAFKDCFFSGADGGGDPIDGDEHAELEALLSALSGGPVGIGDRVGRTDREVVMRTCDDDGRLRRVDQAIAATDASLFGAAQRGEGLLWATTTSTTEAGVWRYVVAINTATAPRTISGRFECGQTHAALDWRTGAVAVLSAIDVTLESRDFAFHVIAPTDDPSAFAAADRSKYVVVEAD